MVVMATGARSTRTAPATRGLPAGRRRASHSMEAVLTEAVALLDEAGESALTFRSLAARLGGGVASIYWYVASKDELLDRASDHVLAGVLADTEQFAVGPPSNDPDAADQPASDPIDDLRAIADTLFDAVADRPWLGAFFMRSPGVQANGLLLYERMGQQVMRLKLSAKQSFHAVSAILGFVIGTATDLGQQPPEEVEEGLIDRDGYLAQTADQWRQLDPGTYPFLRFIVDEFSVHDDADQFHSGLELILAGIRLEAHR